MFTQEDWDRCKHDGRLDRIANLVNDRSKLERVMEIAAEMV